VIQVERMNNGISGGNGTKSKLYSSVCTSRVVYLCQSTMIATLVSLGRMLGWFNFLQDFRGKTPD